MMVLNFGKQQMHKKLLVVLICLLIAGNLAHGPVLCFGEDGHVELESASHRQCQGSDHFQSSGDGYAHYDCDQEKGKHCAPCSDIPVFVAMTKIKKPNSTFTTPSAKAIVTADNFDYSAKNSISNSSNIPSYFTALRTVILLV